MAGWEVSAFARHVVAAAPQEMRANRRSGAPSGIGASVYGLIRPASIDAILRSEGGSAVLTRCAFWGIIGRVTLQPGSQLSERPRVDADGRPTGACPACGGSELDVWRTAHAG